MTVTSESARRMQDDQETPDLLAGEGPVMQQVRDLVCRLADRDATVLVTGESGTGKELVARALHSRGKRRGGPFLAINCAALPATLLESELFGYRRGAFTDAHQARTGMFVAAGQGTIFLDEIGEVDPSLQPKLLRALQEHKVRPLGADDEIPFTARIVAATNRDLGAAVEQGRFRQDLYYRLNVVEIHLPPLRSRGNDVLTIADRLLRTLPPSDEGQLIRLSAAAASKLLAYDWPGNVRELQNALEHAAALATGSEIDVAHLPTRIGEFEPDHVLVAARDQSELPTLEEVERRYILRVMDATGGQRKVAAKILGVDRKTLYRKLDQYRRQGYLDGEERDG